MVDSQWKQITQTPNLKLLTKQMLAKMLQNSLLCQDDLPRLIKKFFLRNMSSKYYPSNYKLIDNNDINNHMFGTIIIQASVKIGYTNALIGLKQLRKNVFGFQQLILSTNYYHRHLNVILAKQAQVFILDQLIFRRIFNQIKVLTNDTFQSPIQLYQTAKDKIISQSKREPCIYCNFQDHTLMNCKQCHYVPEISYSNLYKKHFYQQRQNLTRRRNVRSFKFASLNSPINSKQMKKLNKKFYGKVEAEQYSQKLKNMHAYYIKKLLQYSEEPNLKNTQTYFQWKFYSELFNL